MRGALQWGIQHLEASPALIPTFAPPGRDHTSVLRSFRPSFPPLPPACPRFPLAGTELSMGMGHGFQNILDDGVRAALPHSEARRLGGGRCVPQLEKQQRVCSPRLRASRRAVRGAGI